MQDLVEVKNNQLIVKSNLLAKALGLRHDNVMRSLNKLVNKISLLKFEETDYIDKNGDHQRAYQLNEEQFLICMPFIGGLKSLEGQARLVQEFLRMREVLASQERKQITHTNLQDSQKLLSYDVKRRHEELSTFVDEGFIFRKPSRRTFYTYGLTDRGVEHGWTRNKNGTVIPPTLN